MRRVMDSRENLMNAILEQVRETGYKNATTKKIAERAGMNEASIFRIFGNKDQLFLEAVYQKTISTDEIDLDVISSLPDFRARVDCFLDTAFYLYYRQMAIFRIFMLSIIEETDTKYRHAVFSRVQSIIDLFCNFLQDECDKGNIRSADFSMISDIVFSALLITALRVTGEKHGEHSIRDSANEFVQKYTDFLCRRLMLS